MSEGLSAEIRKNNWDFLIHKLLHSEAHEAVVETLSDGTQTRRLLRHHREAPVTDPREIEYRAQMDLWLGQASITYLAWLCGYIPDPASMHDAGIVREVLSKPEVRPYYEQHYPVAIPWLFRLHLDKTVSLPCESSMDGTGAFERFSILYERFREDEDLGVFLNMLDGFVFRGISVDSVVTAFQNPDRVAQALARPADQITYLDRGISGMVRFLTFCHDLDELLRLCKGMPLVQSAFWFFYGYWFREFSLDVAEKSMEALDKVMRAADSSGNDSTLERSEWQLLLQRLTSGEYAKRLVQEMEHAAGANGEAAEWLVRFGSYAQPLEKNAPFIGSSPADAPPLNEARIAQCRDAIRHVYTVRMFSEKLAPAIHELYRRNLKEHERGGLFDRPYEELDDPGKGANLAAALRIPEILTLVGYGLEVGENTPEEEREIGKRLESNIERLAEAEHDGWAEERRLTGWSYAPVRDNKARHHPLLVPYAALPDHEKEKDRRTVLQYPSYAKLGGLKIVQKRG